MAFFVVTVADDSTNPNDGLFSLREVITLANANGEADTIAFAIGTPSVVQLTDDLVITDDVMISGAIRDEDDNLIGTHTIRAADGQRIFTYTGDGTFEIEDIVLRNGDGGAGGGGAVLSSTDTELTNVTISGSETTGPNQNGGAVSVTGRLTIDDSTFTDNATNGDQSLGGAVYATGNTIIRDSTFTGNATNGELSRGGAVYSVGTVATTDSDYTSNTTAGTGSDGGAIFGASTVTVTRGSFTTNATVGNDSPGGAIAADDVSATDATFDANSTAGPRSGGGAIDSDATITVTGGTITDNTTAGTDSPGGALNGQIVTVASTAEAVAGNATIADRSPGGAIAAQASLTLTGTDVSANSTTGVASTGGALFSGGTTAIEQAVIGQNTTLGADASGGALFSQGVLTVDQATFIENTTTGAGAMGGGLAAAGTARITGSNFETNATLGGQAPGGGIAAMAAVTVIDTTITGNTTTLADGRGGGLFAADAATLLNTTLSANTTVGDRAEGGGAYIGGTATVANTTFADNATFGGTASGGGLFAAAALSLLKSTLTGNRTDGTDADGGGLFYAGETSIGDSIVLGNAAILGEGDDTASGDGAVLSVPAGAGNILDDSEVTAADVFATTVELAEGILAGVLSNGGTDVVSTVALLEQSANPAIDVGSTTLLSEGAIGLDLNGDGDQSDTVTTDARGGDFLRNVDIETVGNDTTGFGDFGAFEATAANRVPVAAPDSASFDDAGGTVEIDVLANDSDADDGDAISIIAFDDSQIQGTATLDFATGLLSYTTPGEDVLRAIPGAGALVEELTYTIADASNGTATGTVTITITGENDAPVGVDDTAEVGALAAPVMIDVLANDSDPDTGDMLMISGINDAGLQGAASISDAGDMVIYDPDGAFSALGEGETATETFTYTVTDGTVSTSASVTVTVTGESVPNTDPVALDDADTILADAEEASFDVLANDTDADGDMLTIVGIDTDALLGAARIADDGLSLLYDPSGAFDELLLGDTALETIGYTVSDGISTAEAEIAIAVEGVFQPNRVPEAADDSASGEAGASILIDVLANDTDEDGDALTVEIVSGPAQAGRVVVTETNEVVLRAAEGFTGQDSFTYRISDGTEGGTAEAEVSLEITEPAETGDGVTLGEAQRIAYIYEAGLDRDGNIDVEGLNFWIDALAAGVSERDIAASFLTSDEFIENFGDVDELTNLEFVDLMFENVLGRPGDDFGRGFWTGRLADPDFESEDMLVAFSTSAENIAASPMVTDLSYDTDQDLWVFA